MAGAVASPGAHADDGVTAADIGLSQCANSGRLMPQKSPCWAAQASVTLTSANPVAALDGAAVVVDTRQVDKTKLDYFSAVIHCYNSAGVSVFGLGAIRNIWPGVNPGGNYPKGVLKAAQGTYTCRLEVQQTFTGNANTLSYSLTTNRLLATPSKTGATSSGPAYGSSWLGIPPSHPDSYVLGTGQQVEGARTQLGVPAGVSVVQVSSMANLTSCSADSDVNNVGCPPKVYGGTLVSVDLLIWQTLSDGHTQCRPPTDYVQSVTLDQYIHHYTPSMLQSYSMVADAGCTRTVVAKNVVSLAGNIAVYMTNQNTAIGIYV